MKEGRLIETHNPQPEVRRNAETAAGWEYKEEAQFLYRMAVVFRDRLVDPILRVDRSQVPDPVISFADERNNNTLASYTLNRNPQGLLHEITMNTAHYVDNEGRKEWRYGRWAQCETLLHEMLHLKQQKYGREPYKKGRNTHNKEFCEMAKQLGLNVMPGYGCHTEVADEGSPFAILMKEMGIPRPADVPRAEGKFDWFEIGKKEKGRSTIHKHFCPSCGEIWYATRNEPKPIMHPECGVLFVAALNCAIEPDPPKKDGKPMTREEYLEWLDGELERRKEQSRNPNGPYEDPEDLGNYLSRYEDDRGYLYDPSG